MKRITFFAAFVGLLFISAAQAQLKPEESMKKFVVADGLQIELFAAEPMVINPTSMDVDDKGRVWITEAVNYRRTNFKRPILREEGDRIVVLEDTTGTGKADKSHVFYQGKEIYGPLGVAVAPYPNPDKKGAISYRVFVCQSPDILVFEDKDGDLKADGPPTKFLTGFGGFDHDHGVHGINIGPDGKLYFTVGDQGVKNLQASDGKGPKFNTNPTDCRAGTVWRCDMDGKNLELLAHNFRNNYECCVNSFGEIWLSDNDDDGNQQTRICHVMPGGNYGYHPRGPGQSHWHEEQPGIVHKTMRTGFGSPTGICFYEGTLLPKKYQGQLLHCDAGPREVRAFHIKPKGAGYELEKEVIVTSTDNWFRPSDVTVAPDGSIFIADWYDRGVGGHGMGDPTDGRVYRVTPKGHKGYKVPEVKLDAFKNFVQVLGSPCLATQQLARAAYPAAKKDNYFMAGTEKLKIDDFTDARLLWLVELSSPFLNFSKSHIKSDKPHVQIVGMRMWSGRNIPSPAKESLFPGIDLNALTVPTRREMLLSFPKIELQQVSAPFYNLAKLYDGQDRTYLAALNIACGTDPERRDAILADFDKHFPEWNDKVADLVWELRPKSVLPRMEKLLADAKLTGPQKARIIDILAASDDVAAGQTMLALLKSDVPAEVKTRAISQIQLFLPGKWKGLQGSKELTAAIDGLLASPATKINGLQLIGAANVVEQVDEVAKIATNVKSADDKVENAARLEAVRTLGKLKTAKAMDALEAMLKPGLEVSELLAIETINAFGAHLTPAAKGSKDNTAPRALTALSEMVLNQNAGGKSRRAALEALAGSPTGTQWLLDAADKKQLPTDLLADAGKLLRNSPYQGLRNRALLLFPAPGKLDPKKLPTVTELAKRIGNAEHGRAVLAASLKGETQCLKCHTVRGTGGNIGPDLSMIGKKASKENLYESLLLPSKAIADQYLQWKIETTAGTNILGLLVEDNAAGVIIRDANGKDTKLAKADIESRTKSPVSIMPEDVIKGFTEDDLIDVVEYLFTLKTASLTPETWHIAGPFENQDDKGLDAEYEPEKATTIDLSATYKGKNGPVKWAPIRQDGTGYVNLAARQGPGSTTNTTSYLYQQIDSLVDQEATILLGNDDGAKIWVNGTKVFENRDHFAATPERHKIAVKLKKGNNTVLMKIVNGNDPHGFYLSLTSEQELKVVMAK
ncbi:MAG: c-type cytochrome [Planctomycetes bacterium]|nr:c-type cytochrome [Planctomycetota bacterium]